MLNKLTKMLIKQLATSQFKGVYRKKEKKNIWWEGRKWDKEKESSKEKKEMQPIERGDGSYRRAEHCVAAVNKGHHNAGSYPVRSCNFFAIVFPPLT